MAGILAYEKVSFKSCEELQQGVAPNLWVEIGLSVTFTDSVFSTSCECIH